MIEKIKNNIVNAEYSRKHWIGVSWLLKNRIDYSVSRYESNAEALEAVKKYIDAHYNVFIELREPKCIYDELLDYTKSADNLRKNVLDNVGVKIFKSGEINADGDVVPAFQYKGIMDAYHKAVAGDEEHSYVDPRVMLEDLAKTDWAKQEAKEWKELNTTEKSVNKILEKNHEKRRSKFVSFKQLQKLASQNQDDWLKFVDELESSIGGMIFHQLKHRKEGWQGKVERLGNILGYTADLRNHPNE